MFKELSVSLADEVQKILVPETSYLHNEAEFYVNILDFQPGSVIDLLLIKIEMN